MISLQKKTNLGKIHNKSVPNPFTYYHKVSGKVSDRILKFKIHCYRYYNILKYFIACWNNLKLPVLINIARKNSAYRLNL